MAITRRLTQAPAFESGTEMHYSIVGFSVAAALLERVTGSDWHSLVRRLILEPLPLDSAGLAGRHARMPTHRGDISWATTFSSHTIRLTPINSRR